MGHALFLIIGLPASLCIAPSAYAGAWPIPKGKGQVIAGLSMQTASESFDDDCNTEASDDFRKLAAEAFWQHGLTDSLTLFGKVSAESVQIETDDGPETQTEEEPAAQIGLRKAFYKTNLSVLSMQISGLSGQATENIQGTTFGSDDPEYEVAALAGRSGKWAGYAVFTQAELGYRVRSKGFSNEYRFDITAGIDPAPRYQVFLQAFYAQAGNSSEGFRRYKRLKLQPSLTYQYQRGHRVQIGVSKTVMGENSIDDTGAFIALWHSY